MANGTENKQRKVIALMATGMTRGEAMQKAGYSKSYSTSGEIRSSKTWQKLMDEYLKQEDLLRNLNGLIGQKVVDKIQFGDVSDNEIKDVLEKLSVELLAIKDVLDDKGRLLYRIAYYSRPETAAVAKGLDMAFKIRGSYAATKIEDSDKLKSLQSEKLILLERYKKLKGDKRRSSNQKKTQGN